MALTPVSRQINTPFDPIQGREQTSGRYSTRFSSLARKVGILSVGIFAIHALTSIPKAEAGFGFFTVCMAACTSATWGFGVMACAAACSASLAPIVP